MDYQRACSMRGGRMDRMGYMSTSGNCASKEVPDESSPMGCVYPSLSMVYLPLQKFEDLYDRCQGLKQGTIFRELDKPFLGYKKCGGCMR